MNLAWKNQQQRYLRSSAETWTVARKAEKKSRLQRDLLGFKCMIFTMPVLACVAGGNSSASAAGSLTRPAKPRRERGVATPSKQKNSPAKSSLLGRLLMLAPTLLWDSWGRKLLVWSSFYIHKSSTCTFLLCKNNNSRHFLSGKADHDFIIFSPDPVNVSYNCCQHYFSSLHY